MSLSDRGYNHVMQRTRILALALVVACSPANEAAPNLSKSPAPTTTAPSVPVETVTVPDAPAVPAGPPPAGASAVLDRLWASLATEVEPDAITALAAYEDPRLAWPLTDLMRFLRTPATVQAARDSFEGLTAVSLAEPNPWTEAVNLLLAWDTPAPPGYLDYKRDLFTLVDPRWEPFFTEPSALDYRLIGWGGVLIDDRPLGTTDPCARGCIPALDDPAVTDTAGGDWLADDFPVFGVVIGQEARAYPKNMMEVHEMVNDTLGGRRIAFPYCTLCGSAQVYVTDELDQPIVMRTSGLLSRSNKVMFDLTTMSAFDTFTGTAVTGPLFEAGVVLDEVTVITSTWGAWKAAHPDTTILAEDGGLGRTYDLDPLGGRDDNGPIFPIGARDPRLPVQEQVLGVVLDDGTTIAFPVAAALWELVTNAGTVELEGVHLEHHGGGLRAALADDTEIAAHQAFWFAWSQFHPDTLLWAPSG